MDPFHGQLVAVRAPLLVVVVLHVLLGSAVAGELVITRGIVHVHVLVGVTLGRDLGWKPVSTPIVLVRVPCVLRVLLLRHSLVRATLVMTVVQAFLLPSGGQEGGRCTIRAEA